MRVELGQSASCVAQSGPNECPIYARLAGVEIIEVTREQAGIIYTLNNFKESAPTSAVKAAVAYVSGNDSAFAAYEMHSPVVAYSGLFVIGVVLCVALPWFIGRKFPKREQAQ